MKKSAFILMMCLVSMPAMADWVLFGAGEATNKGIQTSYYDSSSLRKNNNFIKVWTLTSNSIHREFGDFSDKSLHEHDCKQERFRILNITAYSEQMGKGSVIFQKT